MEDFNLEIEKFWRERFADEVESCMFYLEDDEPTKWFNYGMQHAARIVRYSRDNERQL